MADSAVWPGNDDLVFGQSPCMREIRCRLQGLLHSPVPLLIEGESGVGKDVLAQCIHRRSSGPTASFLKVDCTSTSNMGTFDEMVSAALKSFPGGRSVVSSGTILFDNVGELDITRQVQLIATVEYAESAAVRIICTCRMSLKNYVEHGRFRKDLHDRISSVTLYVPPLRERRVDIPLLACHFLKHYMEAYRRPAAPFSSRLIELFLSFDWPGNVRELQNTVRDYVLFGSEEAVIANLGGTAAVDGYNTPHPLSLKLLRRQAIRDCDCKAILVSLHRNHWNRRRTARELQISYRSLLNTMKELGLPAKRSSAVAAPKGVRNRPSPPVE